MALDAYLKLTGQKQGLIKGSVTQKGKEGMILVIAATHEVVSPRDAASGMATGKRQHRPFTIVKSIDKSSPLLMNALVNNEQITQWQLQFFSAQSKAVGATGTVVNHYTVQLNNAQIISIKMVMPNNKTPELAQLAEYEEIQFSYEKIEWTWTDGTITATDSWA